MDFLIHRMLRTSAARQPDKEALVHRDERLGYAEMAQRVNGLACGLREAGVERRDRVGIFLDHSVPLALSIFAVSQAGGVFVPINAVLYPDQVGHIANDCQMKGLITSTSKLPALAPVLATVPSLQFLVIVDDGGSARADGVALPVHDFARLSRPSAQACPDLGIDRDLAALLYTSGSTGKPKGVMVTHAQVMAGSSIVSTYLGIAESERILSVLPFSFDAGLNQLMTAVQQGATCILTRFVFAREIVQVLERERITGLAGVPTVWALLAQPSSALARTPLPHLRYITNTGGRMPKAVLDQLRKALPNAKVFLMYGLTEAFRSTYLPPEEVDRRPSSIGKAIPNTEILVINDDGQPCKPGEVGQLVHRGPTVSSGYWGRTDLTNEVLRPHPLIPAELGGDERVCYSGDLVTMDEDGFLYYIGRRDTMIKSSGFRISPTEVEEILFSSGRLRGAAVIGIPDDILGQAVKAFVVAREGERLDTASLMEFCATRMPRYMVPAAIEVLDELPKTGTGKVDYPALRRREGLAA
ncbi:MAG: acyl-CoA ligase (AMP-forming), exosortase A system-associated [Candidatus Rokubacteria bacterium]|nr:acyl-CoA ligase (AMP-forming), exosortase A system-associated [Candidatus Rokubacteria bacterium]